MYIIIMQNEQGEKTFTWKALTATENEVEVYMFEGDAKFRAVKGTKGGRSLLSRSNLLLELHHL